MFVKVWAQTMMPCGKHRGRSYEEVAALDRGYCAWVLNNGANTLAFQGFANFLHRTHGGLLKVGRHKGMFFDEAWEIEREYCYWAACLESPSEPMKPFTAFARVKVAQEAEEEKDQQEPEHKRMRSQSFKCQICFDATVRSVLVPCGHMMCPECAAKIRGKKCPFCRCKFQQIVKVFI